jgi:hypothetical protein
MPNTPNVEVSAESTVLHVRQLTEGERADATNPRAGNPWDQWRTTQPLDAEVDNNTFVVRTDFPTDLVSVPNIFAWFIPRAGQYARAAVLHDYLWCLSERGEFDRRQADRNFRLKMQADEVPLLRRWIMWAAVRLASLTKRGGAKGWWKDLPAVLLMLVIAAPIVIPPAVLILVSSLVFQAIELIASPLDGSQARPKLQLKT